MGDYADLCELYGINPGDVNGFEKILDIWMDNRYGKQTKKSKGLWIPAPSGKIGNLTAWKKRMKEQHHSPKIGDVVEQIKENGTIIGYQCTSYNGNEPNWLRVAWQESKDDLD
jgi:hypothetical protein